MLRDIMPYKLQFGIILAVLTVGCNLSVSTSTPMVTQPTEMLFADPIVVSKTTSVAMQTKQLDEREIDPAYALKVKYPSVSELEYPLFKDFNREVLRIMLEDIAQFRRDVWEFRGIPPASSGSFMYVDYEATFNRIGVLSILFTYDFYLQGAAHPFRVSKTLTYLAETEQFLDLVDLFQPGVDYLEQIAEYCTKDLTRRGLLEFPGGAEPRAENYLLWNITPHGLLITFDEYSVGPYAMGRQQVLIPYPEVVDILAAGGLLARIQTGD